MTRVIPKTINATGNDPEVPLCTFSLNTRLSYIGMTSRRRNNCGTRWWDIFRCTSRERLMPVLLDVRTGEECSREANFAVGPSSFKLDFRLF